MRNAWTFDINGTDFRTLAGNYIKVASGIGYAVNAHAQMGSLKLSTGDKVTTGQWLANVGHSGNSTAPNLHFHRTDHQDPRKAQGILYCFTDYEVCMDGAWRPVENAIPRPTDRIRRLGCLTTGCSRQRFSFRFAARLRRA